MFNLRRVFVSLAVLGCLSSFVSQGQAQTTVGTSVTLPKTGISHSRANRGNNQLINKLNYDDCHLDDRVRFALSLGPSYASFSLQVWAGAACDATANRITVNQVGCWQIGSGIAPTTINPPPIELKVRDILYGRTLASPSTGVGVGTGGTGGTDAAGGGSGTDVGGSSGSSGANAGTTSAGTTSAGTTEDDPGCTDRNAVSAAQNIIVYFMLIDSANNVAGFDKWSATYKLAAPAPPDQVAAGIGENSVPVTFKYSASADTTIEGYNVYCDPPPGVDYLVDAGLLPEEGSALPGCAGSTMLTAGARPNSSLLCGNSGVGSQRINAANLVNGVAYNVAVATKDSYGNTGVLSKVVCQVPQPVTGFFDAYRAAGGRGAGGFCSFSPRKEPLPLLALIGFATCLVLRRRRAA